MPSHLVPLSGSWALWRTLAVRGAGLPVARLAPLTAPVCAAAADRLLGLEDAAESSRWEALAVVRAALRTLREEGAWEDRARREPLARASRDLSRGRPPREAGLGGEAAERFRAALAGLEEARAAFLREHAAAVSSTTRELARAAGDPELREAVAWQSSRAIGHVLDPLVRQAHQAEGAGPSSPAPREHRERRRDELVVNYLQRYCAKNDTIGFFGPVGWGRLVDAGPPADLAPGPRLLARREVYFEHWAIAALAEHLAGEPALRPSLAPRLRTGAALLGDTLHLPGGRSLQLSAGQLRLLAVCNGRRPAREIAAVAGAAAGQVLRLLETLAGLGALTWTLEVPLELHPERTLRQALSRVEPEPLRARLLATLDELEQARDRLAAATGNAEAVERGLRELEEVFSRLTGQPAERRTGLARAARGLVYEDCRRDLQADFGPGLIERLRAPLRLVLDAARWLAGELTRTLEGRLRSVYADVCQETGAGAVDSAVFFDRAVAALFLARERDPAFAALEADFQARWARILGLPAEGGSEQPAGLPEARRLAFTAAELAAGCARELGPPAPAWRLARYFSPDVMIAAAGPDALRRGEAQIVLSELHTSNTLTTSLFVSQHPRPEEIVAHLESDLSGAPVVVPQFLVGQWPQRANLAALLPGFLRFEHADEPPIPGARALPAGLVVIEETPAGLRARTRDGQLDLPAAELFSVYLTWECNRILGQLLPAGPHRPRVTVDDVVLCREAWRFAADDLHGLAPADPAERFLAVRRWARGLGLPRRSFFKLSSERKPCYLDLDSPLSVDLFVRMVRAAAGAELALSEMLPDTDQVWLPDAAGQLYTCELRLVALDQAPEGGASR